MPKDKRLYLSGPMSGLPNLNHPAFHAEASRLRSEGYFVINPAELDLDEGATWEDYMRANVVQMISTCNAIHLLPGWSKSPGATTEHTIAKLFGFEVSLAAGAEEVAV